MTSVPKWYQELSIPQINRIRILFKAIKCDFDEKLTVRTRKVLTDIGIISTFVKISSNELKKIFKKSQMDPGRFLCEIYRSITGNYFEEERNKKFYDCNQRLILTAIAFLYLPETIIELHRRLPITKKNYSSYSQKNFPPVKLHKKSAKSPYLESHKPQVILPPFDLVLKSEQLKKSSQKNLKKKNSQLTDTARNDNDKKLEFNEYDPNILKISKENEEKQFEEKEDIYLNVFRSKDNFFTLLENSFKINEINKINNLRRRKYLSKNWEESLRNVDEEFVILSRKANDILKNVNKTTRRIFNVDLCSHCCTQKSKIPTKKKTKNLLIDSLILYGNCRRKFIGSVTLNSPLQSLPASEHSFSKEITLSEDKLIKKNIICGSIIIDGKLINQIGGIFKNRLHISHKIPYSERIKNILPCNCYCTEENEEKNQIVNKIDKLQCQQCFDAINPSLKNFLAKKNIKEQTVQQIDHTTCTQRFYTDEKKVEENKKECCMKCINFPDKCKRSINLLEEILKFGDEEKLKEDKNNIKFSIKGLKKIDGGDGESCQHIISNVMLCTPKIITSISSKSDVTIYSSLSQNNFVSEIKLNDGKKLFGKQKIAKIISDNKNRVKEEMMELYKQIEELENIKNKLNKNLGIIKTDPMIKDTGVIKKQSKKKIVGKNFKIKKKFIRSKKIVDNEANSEKFEEENLETIKTNSKNVIKKQIADVKNNMEMEKNLITSEVIEDTESYSEKSEEYDKNAINEEKKDGDLSKHNNLITLMKTALKEMANENFLLAKLPDCDKLPQLQMWIKCRKEFVSFNLEKDELRDKIQNIGNEQFDETSKIVAPQIKLDKYQGTLNNYCEINKLKNLVEMKKKLFYSKVRKSRVNVSRSAWNQLQFDNYTSDLLFKRTYFIYQPAKEADGFILKPYGFQSPKKKKKKV
ncbi:uncharacterized protein LOC141533403 [Cotesia typhae]|uniref:uncharacterized protein LOC141533403 n=1 Tax=Cotesia typhae TaxID=2053667 RepID=UPI003D68876E